MMNYRETINKQIKILEDKQEKLKEGSPLGRFEAICMVAKTIAELATMARALPVSFEDLRHEDSNGTCNNSKPCNCSDKNK